MDGHSKIDAFVAEVARFGGRPEELSPEMRLQAAARLWDGLVQVAQAVVDAVDDGRRGQRPGAAPDGAAGGSVT